jgi:ABC-type sugar transport system permease subunit
MYAYQVSMKNGNLGYGSAIAYALLIMITIFTMIFLSIARSRAASTQ